MRIRERPPTRGSRIYICVRRTLEWEHEALVAAGLKTAFRPKVEVWNATFDVPYHTFRHRLKRIAQTSLARVEEATCAPFDQVPGGAVVVPVDDDDWLSPDLATEIREHYDPAVRGYHWIPYVIELPRRVTMRSWLQWLRRDDRLRCATNNYAVANVTDRAPLVYDHMKATEYFKANSSRIGRISKILSIQNRNMASQTAMGWMRPSITREELLTSFQRYRILYASLELPRELGWARPYVDSMAELMQQIRVK